MPSKLLWTPRPEYAGRSQMHDFMVRMARKHGFEPRWEPLWRWSIERPDQFWAEMLEVAQVEPSSPARATMSGRGMLGTKWFEGMTLNYARHLLRFDNDDDAILFEDELGRHARLSHRQLRAEVARCAAALREAGVTRGDRVAGFMPNVPETVIAMLAAASLGAAWSSCSPDFGVRGVLDRFGQIEPKVLVTVDGYSYGGKPQDIKPRLRELLPALPSVRQCVLVPFLDPHARADDVPGAVLWREFMGAAAARAGGAPPLRFEEVPFDHPLFIMYSSGTTGVPKCIVHGHGGTLLQHMKELMLHCDLRAGERIFYFTTCGWMMWNWLVSGLGVGAAVVLYEGNPGHPTMDRLWKLAADLRLHVFGTSAKFIAACEKADVHPGRDFDLSALRCVCSTGSPLSAELFEWTYQRVKADLQLSSICGGTDIISCFILGNPLLPVHAGEIQCRGLGMDVQAWNDRQEPVVGQKGELVCCTPFPCQPVGFWNDPDGSKYRGAYFDYYAEGGREPAAGPVWRHGDFIEITDTGGIVVYGRSDATLNPGGVRIGTAEIYRVVEGIPEIVDSIVVGKDTPDQDVEVCLFVVLRPGLKLDAAFERRIRDAIASGATKRHVPRHIRQVRAVPYTINGKKVELAVRQAIHGQDVPNKDALANPEALEEYRGLV
ncbi:MAG: acetoacetate--CoA ligase [Phycisphaerales bacterium]|nr:acetoacetate--CoA ligase [Phycisphaerales bacterium]